MTTAASGLRFVCVAAHERKFLDGPPQTSNFYCHPGGARAELSFCVSCSATAPFGTLRLSLCDDPRQNRLHGGESWIVGLSNDREQLKPQVIVGAFDEFPNRTRHKVRHRHGRCRCAAFDLSRDIRMQRRHDAGRDVRSIKLRDQFSKHAALCSWANLRDHPALLGQATEPFIEREVPQFR